MLILCLALLNEFDSSSSEKYRAYDPMAFDDAHSEPIRTAHHFQGGGTDKYIAYGIKNRQFGPVEAGKSATVEA